MPRIPLTCCWSQLYATHNPQAAAANQPEVLHSVLHTTKNARAASERARAACFLVGERGGGAGPSARARARARSRAHALASGGLDSTSTAILRFRRLGAAVAAT